MPEHTDSERLDFLQKARAWMLDKTKANAKIELEMFDHRRLYSSKDVRETIDAAMDRELCHDPP